MTTPRPRRTPARRAARATARRPLACFASPEEQALIAPWNAGRGVPLADVRRAAEQGNGIALNILGILYFDGDGVRRNVATAARKFRASAERGYAGGQGNIGHAYAVGAGVDQDDAQALYWLQLAAEDGRRTTGLAFLYDIGQGVPQDFAEAARLFRLAAEQGNGIARIFLKYRYPTVPTDKES